MDLNDARLTSLCDTPPPVFAATLRKHLHAVDRAAAPRAGQTTGRWLRSALAPVAIATVIGVLMTMPAVRASAAAFLARFRVVNFVAVPVDPSRFAALGSEQFDPGCIRLIREAAERLGVAHRDILSQAGHDAYYVSRVAPTAMIFTPCRDGVSHNEAEHAELDTTVPGVNVLLHAVLARADR